MTNVYAPQYSERTEDPSEGLMIGSNNTFIYTASLCECNSWRKSKTGVLETTVTRREKPKSHKEVCFAALPIWPCCTIRLNIVYRRKNTIISPLHETDVCSFSSSLCRQGICSDGSSWGDTRKTLPSFSIYFSHNLNSNWWTKLFLWGPFHLRFFCSNC